MFVAIQLCPYTVEEGSRGGGEVFLGFVCQITSFLKSWLVQEFKPDQMKWNQHKASIDMPFLCK